MSIETTAAALVQDDVMSAPVETPTESAPSGEIDLNAELSAIWDKSQAEGVDEEAPQEAAEAPTEAEDEPKEAEAPDAEEAATDEPETQEQAPSELPAAIKKNWAAIPQEARDAFLESQREANRKLGEQGRLMQGIAPIRDVLAEAVKELPTLANMKPQDVAREVMQLAKISNDFNTKPVETIFGLIKQHGLEQAIAQHFTGQGVTPDAKLNVQLQQEVNNLKRQLRQISDPEYMASQFDAFSTQQQAHSVVTEFAASKPEWAEVEPYLPAAIEFVKASSATQLSTKDTLERAYTLALSQIKPDAFKAETTAPAPKAVAVADPERSRKAIQAKSANLPDRGGAKPKPLTERQLMEQVWSKHQSS